MVERGATVDSGPFLFDKRDQCTGHKHTRPSSEMIFTVPGTASRLIFVDRSFVNHRRM